MIFFNISSQPQRPFCLTFIFLNRDLMSRVSADILEMRGTWYWKPFAKRTEQKEIWVLMPLWSEHSGSSLVSLRWKKNGFYPVCNTLILILMVPIRCWNLVQYKLPVWTVFFAKISSFMNFAGHVSSFLTSSNLWAFVIMVCNKYSWRIMSYGYYLLLFCSLKYHCWKDSHECIPSFFFLRYLHSLMFNIS